MAFIDLIAASFMIWLSAIVIGYIPLLIPQQWRHQRWVITMGVGALIGTAFVVILPEGIHTMYQPPRQPQTAHTITPGDKHLTITDSLPLALPSVEVPELPSWSNPLIQAGVVSGDESPDWKGPLNKFKVEHDIKGMTTSSSSTKPTSKRRVPPASKSLNPEIPAEQGDAHGHAHEHGHEGKEDDESANGHTHATKRHLLETDEHDHEHDHSHSEEPEMHSTNDHSSHEDHTSYSPSASHASMSTTDQHTHIPISSSRFDVVTINPYGSSEGTVEASITPYAPSTLTEKIVAVSRPIILVCFEEGHGSKWMGLSMAIGFVFMLLIERLSPRQPGELIGPPSLDIENGGSSPLSTRNNVELKSRAPSDKGGLSTPELRNAAAHAGSSSTPRVSLQAPIQSTISSLPAVHLHSSAAPAIPQRKFDRSTMFGPFLHVLIEGLNLGALAIGSSVGDASELFMATVLHKAPLAFGITSFLLYQGRSLSDVRKQLVLYASLTPIGALFMFTILGETDLMAIGDGSLFGLLTLFSGGCFIFTIAVHILPEIQAQNSKPASTSPSSSSGNSLSRSTSSIVGSPVRLASPTPSSSRSSGHDDHAHASPEGSPSTSSTSTSDESSKVIPWPYVWALIVGLLLPLLFSYVQERKPLLQ